MREERDVTEEEMGAVEAEFTVVMPRATSRPDARPVSLKEIDHRSILAEVVRLRRQVAAMQEEGKADAARLDWLEAQYGYRIGRSFGGSLPGVSLYLQGDREAFDAPTLRAALDAAREATP